MDDMTILQPAGSDIAMPGTGLPQAQPLLTYLQVFGMHAKVRSCVAAPPGNIGRDCLHAACMGTSFCMTTAELWHSCAGETWPRLDRCVEHHVLWGRTLGLSGHLAAPNAAALAHCRLSKALS